MSDSDKVGNKVEELTGGLKESVGRSTGNADLEAEGRADQTSASLKQAGEKVKDAFKS